MESNCSATKPRCLWGFVKRNSLLITTCSALITLCLFLFTLFYEIYLESQIQVINDSTFVGEVVGKESNNSILGFGNRLHIIGEFIENDEVIQIDRTFRVSQNWYNKFSVGDRICHPYPQYRTVMEMVEHERYVSITFNKRRNCQCLN